MRAFLVAVPSCSFVLLSIYTHKSWYPLHLNTRAYLHVISIVSPHLYLLSYENRLLLLVNLDPSVLGPIWWDGDAPWTRPGCLQLCGSVWHYAISSIYVQCCALYCKSMRSLCVLSSLCIYTISMDLALLYRQKARFADVLDTHSAGLTNETRSDDGGQEVKRLTLACCLQGPEGSLTTGWCCEGKSLKKDVKNCLKSMGGEKRVCYRKQTHSIQHCLSQSIVC